MRAQEYLPPTCKNPYTQAQEIELGDKVVREVYKQMPVLPDADPVAQFVRRLGAQLVAAAPSTPGLEQQWPFNFHVVASSEINAFALPGGTMFVNLGAIQAAQTEAQLAGVMGHEMSHVILRHSTCNLIKQQHRSILYSLGELGSEIALGGAGGQIAAQGIDQLKNLSFLKMSRGDEEQADKLGAQILHDANFDPRGLPQFFEIIEAKYGQGGAQFLSDHPSPGNRTQYLQAEIAAMPPLAHPVVTTPAFAAAHTQSLAEHALSAQEQTAGGWRSSGLYASAPGGGPVAGSRAAGQPASYSPGSAGSGAGTVANPTGLAPLSASQLGVAERFVRVQGPQSSIDAPANWAHTSTSNGGAGQQPQGTTLTVAPPGATGSFGVAYGAVLATLPQGGNGISDTAALSRASDAFAAQLVQSNGLTPEGAATSFQVGGQPAIGRYLRGSSPVRAATSGAQDAERDWLVTVARPDGDLDTLIFVAPAGQFATLQPLYTRMLASFRPQ